MRKRVFILPFLIISLMILLINKQDNIFIRDSILVISIVLFILIILEIIKCK